MTLDVMDPPEVSQGERYAGLAADLEGVPDDRPPLLLLHGLTFDRTMWRPAMAELRRIDPGRRVLALDLPGHGGSTGKWCYDGESVGVAALGAARAAGLRSPVIVGHSYSGILATFVATRSATSGVVNVDQPLQTRPFAGMLHAQADRLRGAGFPAVWAQIAASMHAELLPPAAQQLVRASWPPPQELLLGYWQEFLDGRGADMQDLVDAELAAVRSAGLPYLVVSGHEPDPDYRRWLGEVLPQATLVTWGDSGHFPHLAHPREFAQFLADTGSWGGLQLAERTDR